MNKILIALILIGFTTLIQAADLIRKPSQNGVQATMDKLEAVVGKKGLTVFSRINHQANAEKAGLQMAAAQVLIFGNPKMGTAMMNQDIASGLDLPLRVLVYQDGSGKTWISYHNPQGMKKIYRLEGNAAVDKAEKGLAKMTDAASR